MSTSVLAVLEETSDIKTFRLARPSGFTFTAGQFLAVRVSVAGSPHVRCYSISSSPEAQGYLEISVRRQGLVSTTLHATLRSGSTLTIGRAAGQFVYPAGDDRPLALLAGGIGITPLLSMLRHAVLAHPTRPVTLLYSATSHEDAAFVHELSVIAERHPQVRVALTFSGGTASPPWRTGRIDAAMVRQYIPHPAHTIFYVCGPVAMMTAMNQLLHAEGVPADQIRAERFETAIAATLVNTASAPPAGATAPPAGEYQVTFANSGRTGRGRSSHTLLDIAEMEGVQIASSCRSGVCLTCRTRLAEGDADCRSSMLDDDDRAAGFILPCVTWAATDCVLEA
jgi:ferredoxin-NADP reductase